VREKLVHYLYGPVQLSRYSD